MSTTTPTTRTAYADQSPTRPIAIDESMFRQPIEQTGPTTQSTQVTQTTTQTSLPTPQLGAYRTGMDQIRFWVGAALAAAIAAMASLVGLLLIGGVLHVSVPVGAGVYALMTAATVIGASALYNLMLHVAPHPTTYYGVLAAVLIALSCLLPFTVSMVLFSQIAFAGLNLVIGLLIAFLVPMAVVAARR